MPMVESDTVTVIAQEIQDAMEAQDIKQPGLAAVLGVTQQQVSKWVNGVQTPSLAQMAALAEALGKPRMWLVELALPPKGATARATPKDGGSFLERLRNLEDRVARLEGRGAPKRKGPST